MSFPSPTVAVCGGPRVGDRAPWADGLVTQIGTPVDLPSLHGHQVLLHFHPHEHSALCPVEGYNFLERHGIAQVLIFCVDMDGPDSPLSFTQQYGPIFDFLSDPEHRLARAYGVSPTKEGRSYCSSFLIGRAGRIVYRWIDVDQDQFWNEVRELTAS